MAKSKTTLRDENYELSRRSLIKWSLAAGAAMGVSRTRIVEILDKTAGRGIAEAAGENIRRSVCMNAGGGSLAYFQTLWPFLNVASANNGQYSWQHPGTPNAAPNPDRWWVGPDTPFENENAERQWTGFVCGNNETHTGTPNSVNQLPNSGMIAAMSAVQSATPSVVPIIQITGNPFIGTAQGAPAVTQVGSYTDIVGLFNSAASQAGGILSATGHPELYKAAFDTFLGLNRITKWAPSRKTAQGASSAAGFLGTNLASQLQLTPAEEARYASMRTSIGNIGRTLTLAIKAFKMGLTATIAFEAASGEDPHGYFANGYTGQDVLNTSPPLKQVFNYFLQDMKDNDLYDHTVMTIQGDTYKDPFNLNGWGDGTPGNTNLLYVWGGGLIKSGWFGSVSPDGSAQGFDPATGNLVNYNGQQTAAAASGAVVYAVTGGDQQRTKDFYTGSLAGIVNAVQL
jgi:hypothetical protein